MANLIMKKMNLVKFLNGFDIGFEIANFVL